MDYPALAAKLLESLQALHRLRPQKQINEAMHGEGFILHLITMNHSILPGDISGEMGVSSARVAAALNSLEDKGLITRQIDRSDRRKILVNPTAEGRAQAMENQQKIVGEAAKMLALLGQQDAAEYVRITEKLSKLVSQRSE